MQRGGRGIFVEQKAKESCRQWGRTALDARYRGRKTGGAVAWVLVEEALRGL